MVFNSLRQRISHHHIHAIHVHVTTVGAVCMTLACLVLSMANPTFGPQTPEISEAATCTVSAKLVNSCRPWIGAAVGGYSMVASDATTQFTFANKRLNDPAVLNNPSMTVTGTKHLDLIHTYKTNNNTSFSSTENAFMAQAGTYLLVNYKPDTETWTTSTGGNATVNSRIDALADSFNAKSQYTFFLTIFHEPENDVSSGNCTANASGASAGSPTDYVNMWHNVRSRFDAKGVDNVVWVMNYMGYSSWDCLVPLLWPGNSYVDWIMWDAYASGTGSGANFTTNISHFYNYLTANSTSTYNYASKTWGLAEHGYNNANGVSTQQKAIDYWTQGAVAIQDNTFPLLKAYVAFDTSTNGTSQVGMDFAGAVSTAEQTAYNSFAQAIFDKEAAEVADTTAPAASITSPANGSTVSGTITVGVSATDNTGIVRVDTFWDGSNVIRSATAQNAYGWGAAWDTSQATNGTHTLSAVAYDAANNSATSQITITVQNSAAPPPAEPPEDSPTPEPVTVVDATTGEQIVDGQSSSGVSVGSLVSLDTTTITDAAVIATISKVEFYVDGELWTSIEQPPFALNTSGIAPGEHTIIQRTYFTDGRVEDTTKTLTLSDQETAPAIDELVEPATVNRSSRNRQLVVFAAIGIMAALTLMLLAMTARGRRVVDRLMLILGRQSVR